MKKIVFLGCENSHASVFLKQIQENEKYSDIEVLGVYSEDAEAANTLAEKYGVPVMDRYDEAVDTADGIVVTARHGGKHLPFALPYLKKGMTAFIDKPITVSEEDSVQLMRLCQANGVKISGGSSLRFADWVQELRDDASAGTDGETLGGIVRCPISLENAHGGFFFYAQHLVETVQTIFGKYPRSVQTFVQDSTLTVLFRYDTYDVSGIYTNECYKCYYAARITKTEIKGTAFSVSGMTNPCYLREWDEFYELLSGGEQTVSYSDFISPVFVMNAIYRSMQSGKEEAVRDYTV